MACPRLPVFNDYRRAASYLRLTARELQIVALVAEGMKYKEIGQELNLTEGTVKTTIGHALGRTGSKNAAHLVARWLRNEFNQELQKTA
jgi:DNA-binding CsgD family transcriptional regulator